MLLRKTNLGKSVCADITIGLLRGWPFGLVFSWEAEALRDFLVDGPRKVLLRPCLFAAGAGVLLGWMLVAVAESISGETRPRIWLAASSGLLAFALGALLVSSTWGPSVQGGLLGGAIATVVVPGLIAARVRMGSSS